MLAFSEGVLLAEKSGISRETAVRRAGAQRNRVAYDSVPRTIRSAAAGRGLFDVNMMQKDMVLAMDLGVSSMCRC